MLKRTISTVFVTALLCLVALPVTALAAEGAPNNLYVGNQNVKRGTETTYWSTNNSGELTQSAENNAWNVKYDPNTVTLTLKNATIEGWYDDVNISGSGIYAASSSGPVSLNIVLEEENKVSGMYGIDVRSSGGDASLNINGSGSLTVSGLSVNGIGIFMSSHNSANLTIEEASVTALGSQVGGSGVRLITSQTGSPSLTIEVKGGSLQASGETNGIHFLSNVNDATAVANLNVSGNAMVKASNIITTKDGTGSAPELKPAASGSDGTGGIIWDDKSGTVYGAVTLQEDLTIGEGESLTLDDGASLNAGNHNVIVDGGTLDESLKTSLGNSVTYVVRGVSLDRSALTLTEGGTAKLTAKVEPIDATNKKVTWGSSAPRVATVDASGNVTAVAEGTAIITATTEDGAKTATCTVTVEHAHDPAAAWSSDVSGHWHACAGCSEKLNIAAHSGKVVGKRDATCTEAGYTGDTVCSICGYVVAKGVATPATGHSYQDGACTVCGAQEPAKDGDSIPATGDLAPVACALAGIFGMALVAAGLHNRTSW